MQEPLGRPAKRTQAAPGAQIPASPPGAVQLSKVSSKLGKSGFRMMGGGRPATLIPFRGFWAGPLFWNRFLKTIRLSSFVPKAADGPKRTAPVVAAPSPAAPKPSPVPTPSPVARPTPLPRTALVPSPAIPAPASPAVRGIPKIFLRIFFFKKKVRLLAASSSSSRFVGPCWPAGLTR